MQKENRLNYFKAYKDFEFAVRTQKALLLSMQLELDKMISRGGPGDVKAISYDKVGSGSSKAIDVNTYYKDLHELNNKVIIQRGIVNQLQKEKEDLDKELESWCRKYNDIELQVFYYHHVKGFRLYDVAKLTNYSYDWIRKINSDIKREFKPKRI